MFNTTTLIHFYDMFHIIFTFSYINKFPQNKVTVDLNAILLSIFYLLSSMMALQCSLPSYPSLTPTPLSPNNFIFILFAFLFFAYLLLFLFSALLFSSLFFSSNFFSFLFFSFLYFSSPLFSFVLFFFQ